MKIIDVLRKENEMRKELLTVTAVVLAGMLLLTVVARAQNLDFKFLGPIARVITPNGDGKNDIAIVCVDNPAFSDVQGKVYTLLGAEVSSFGPLTQSITTGMNCPVGAIAGSSEYLTWDGRSSGNVVGSGIYVYRIQAEKRIYSGTILVVR